MRVARSAAGIRIATGTVAALALLGCTGPAPLSSARPSSAGDSLASPVSATGLEGTVTRGPVTPVCRVGVPCDAPFSAWFQVFQGQRRVSGFQSDSAGHYRVFLPPGTYTVVPDSAAPIFPQGQSRPATVGPDGMTRLDLEFDTGIR